MAIEHLRMLGDLPTTESRQENKAEDMQDRCADSFVSSPSSIVIHGLPKLTTQTNLWSLMAWCYDFKEARIITQTKRPAPSGLLSAVFKFSSHSSAQLAKQLFDGKLNIEGTGYLSVAFTFGEDYLVEPVAPNVPNTASGSRRHKWSDGQIAYLQEQFSTDPKPSTADKQRIARELGVGEKHVKTWYNNSRQRQKAQGRFKSIHTQICTNFISILSASFSGLYDREYPSSFPVTRTA